MTNPVSTEKIGTAAEAERVLDNLNTVMDRLIETVEAETAHMRKGRLREALAKLRERHAAFESVLQTNLTVIATAHAVSEGIIRGVSGELARKQTPSTYGAGGRANAPSPRAGQPLAISRTL